MNKFFQIISNYRSEAIYLQKELVRRPALGPENLGQGELNKAIFIENYLNQFGLKANWFKAKDVRVECGFRPNLVFTYPGKKDKKLWIIAHLDVVPPGDLSLWQTDPFELKVDGDLVYGRGVEDNHQAIVSSLLVAKVLAEHSLQPDYGLGLVFVADEETGNKYGLQFLVDHYPQLFAEQDLFLVPDHGAADGTEIEIAEKSMCWLKIEVLGQQCHASVPDKGKNSLLACADYILHLAQELPNHFDLKDSLFNPPYSTFVPTKKEANVENINTIPGRDVFYLDCRVLPNYSLEQVLDEIKTIGKSISQKHGVNLNFELVLNEPAAPKLDPDSALVRRLQRSILKVLGKKPKLVGIGGGTVAAILRRKGYPAVVWSSLLGFAHQPNERSSLANTLNDAKVMFDLLFG